MWLPCTASNGLEALTLPRLGVANGWIVKKPTCYDPHNSQFIYRCRFCKHLANLSPSFFSVLLEISHYGGDKTAITDINRGGRPVQVFAGIGGGYRATVAPTTGNCFSNDALAAGRQAAYPISYGALRIGPSATPGRNRRPGRTTPALGRRRGTTGVSPVLAAGRNLPGPGAAAGGPGRGATNPPGSPLVVATLGGTGTGKSALVNALAGADWSPPAASGPPRCGPRSSVAPG